MKLLLHHYLKTSADTPVDRDIRAQIAAGNYEDHSATRGIRGALNTLLSINASTELTLHKKLAFNQRWYELVGSYSQGALTKQMDKLIAISGGAGLVEKTSHAKYLAGLWSNVAPEFGLLWRATSSDSRRLDAVDSSIISLHLVKGSDKLKVLNNRSKSVYR